MSPRKPCGDCGGPKEPGLPGARYCEACRAHRQALKLCRDCGCEKEPGARAARLCVSCRDRRAGAPERCCQVCGGDKPSGRGRRTCDACLGLPPAARHKSRPRKPCRGCRAEKPPRHTGSYCTACRARRPQRVAGKPMPCHMCGGREGKLPRQQFCEDCRELARWRRERRSVVVRTPRKPCRRCRGVKDPGHRGWYCATCRRSREAERQHRCPCGEAITQKYAQRCPGCRVAARKRRAQRKRAGDTARRGRMLQSIRRRRARRSIRRPYRAGRRTSLPAAPLAAALDRLIATERAGSPWAYDDPVQPAGAHTEIVCERAEITPRALLAWRVGERLVVQLDVADRVLTRLDLFWWDIWNEETVRVPLLRVATYRCRWRSNGKGAMCWVRDVVRTRDYGNAGPDHDALLAVQLAFEGEPRAVAA